MSGQEKTEQPTGKRLADARRKGQVAKSNELNSALVLVASWILLITYSSYLFNYLCRLTRELLHHELRMAHTLTVLTFGQLFRDIVYHVVLLVIPFMLTIMVVGILINILQVKWMVSFQVIKPNFSKLNPIAGAKRFVSVRSLVELAKNLLKMVIVGACGFSIINANKGHLLSMATMGFTEAWGFIFQMVIQIASSIALVMLVLGVVDLWWQKRQLMKNLKMTKQEVKDEMKNAEGNQQIKGKVRAKGQEIAFSKMAKAIPQADVVVTNPTHFAVAIKYDPDVAPAPIVVAKGTDHMALKIRQIAKENKVPIVENRPLARSLYALVEVNHLIPPELFIAVAEVLAFVFKRNKGRRRPQVQTVK
jgi:flagellar biosynthetic protein FlhB